MPDGTVFTLTLNEISTIKQGDLENRSLNDDFVHEADLFSQTVIGNNSIFVNDLERVCQLFEKKFINRREFREAKRRLFKF